MSAADMNTAHARVAEFLRQFGRLRDTAGRVHEVHSDSNADPASLYLNDLALVLARSAAPEAEIRERVAREIEAEREHFMRVTRAQDADAIPRAYADMARVARGKS